MEEDVPHCVMEKEEKCEKAQGGFLSKEKCMSWPVTRCKLMKKVVTKYTPTTKVITERRHVKTNTVVQCTRNPVTLCGPRPCATEKGELECRKKVRTVSDLYPPYQILS